MALPMAVAGGASLIGGLLQSQQQQSQASAQMAFQQEMSGTAYQRAVQDMQKAGINPILAYGMGGATTPGGAQATIPNVVGPAVSSAMGALQLSKQMEQMDAQIKATYDQNMMDTARKKSEVDLNIARTNTENSNARLAELAIPAASNAASLENTKFGAVMPYVERLSRSVLGPLLGAGVSRLVPSLAPVKATIP